jgi:hypothetical protein
MFFLATKQAFIFRVQRVELYSKYIMIMHRTSKLPIKEGNGIAKHDQHVAVAFQ